MVASSLDFESLPWFLQLTRKLNPFGGSIAHFTKYSGGGLGEGVPLVLPRDRAKNWQSLPGRDYEVKPLRQLYDDMFVYLGRLPRDSTFYTGADAIPLALAA